MATGDTAGVYTAIRAKRRWRRFVIAPRSGLRDVRAELVAILCLVPIFLVPALWNGFPFVYYDTAAYVFEGLGGHFMVERSPVYSLFLRFAGAGTNLWIVAALQAFAASFAMTQTARTIAPRMTLGVFLLIGTALAIGTGLPWYIGQIEPDCFTALLTLCIYLLAFHERALGLLRGVAIAVLGAFAAAAHPSHLVLAGFLFVALFVARAVLWLRKNSSWPRPRLLAPACVCILGVALTLAANYHYKRELFLSRAGASFVFARMLQDGIVMRLLDDTCPKSGYVLCRWRDSLPATADAWLWTPDSPFFKLGHFNGTAAESGRIVRDALLRYPLMQLEKATADAAIQFCRFATGEDIKPQQWVLAPVLGRYLSSQMPAYLSARQQHGRIDFRMVSTLHVAVGWLALAALAAVLAIAIHSRRRISSTLLGFVLVALIGNAAICGIISGPHDRYQSRLIWIVPFAILLAAARSHESGSKSRTAPS
jgi:Ca2+/Na+ antiporter